MFARAFYGTRIGPCLSILLPHAPLGRTQPRRRVSKGSSKTPAAGGTVRFENRSRLDCSRCDLTCFLGHYVRFIFWKHDVHSADEPLWFKRRFDGSTELL
jgi:hypothetical protein